MSESPNANLGKGLHLPQNLAVREWKVKFGITKATKSTKIPWTIPVVEPLSSAVAMEAITIPESAAKSIRVFDTDAVRVLGSCWYNPEKIAIPDDVRTFAISLENGKIVVAIV